MKTTFVLLVTLLLVGKTSAQDEQGAVGQYQLVSAIVEIVGKGGATQEHVVFRIDTKTGMTWTYGIGQGKDGKMKEFWSRIPELGEEIKPPARQKTP
jgi:hypothetical protein